MPSGYGFETKAEQQVRIQRENAARDLRLSKRREEAAWSGFEDNDFAVTPQHQQSTSKVAVPPTKSPALRQLQGGGPANLQPEVTSGYWGWPSMDFDSNLDDRDGSTRRGRVRMSALLRSALMPTVMQYDRGMYDQPIYKGEEGIKGISFAIDLRTALGLWFLQEPKSEQAGNPVAKVLELIRALQETFSMHHGGKEWFDANCLHVLRNLANELPVMLEQFASDSVELAPEYKAKLMATTRDKATLAKRVNFWTREVEAGHVSTAQMSAWLVEEASQTLVSSQGSSAGTGGPGDVSVGGEVKTPASSRMTGVTKDPPGPAESARFVNFKQVKEELRLGSLVFLSRDQVTGEVKLFPFRPCERVLQVACEKIKAGPGSKLTSECSGWFQSTTLGVALDGTKIEGDTFDHLNKRLHLFLNLSGAEGSGMTKRTIYHKILHAAKQIQPLALSISTWNIQHNRDCDPDKLAVEADAQWRQVKSEQVGAEMGAATSASRLTTAKECSLLVETMSLKHRALLRKELDKKEAQDKNPEPSRVKGVRVAAAAAEESPTSESSSVHLVSVPMQASSPVLTAAGPSKKAGKGDRSAATAVGLEKMLHKLQAQVAALSVAKPAEKGGGPPVASAQQLQPPAASVVGKACRYCGVVGHLWADCTRKPAGWTPQSLGPQVGPAGRGGGPWVPGVGGRGQGSGGRGYGGFNPNAGRGSGAAALGVQPGPGQYMPQAYMANIELQQGGADSWVPSPWLAPADGGYRAMTTIASHSADSLLQDPSGAEVSKGDEGTRVVDEHSLQTMPCLEMTDHVATAEAHAFPCQQSECRVESSQPSASDMGTPYSLAKGKDALGGEHEETWKGVIVLSEAHVDTARKMAATPKVEWQGERWIRQHLAELAMATAQQVASRWGRSTLPKDIALEVAYHTGLRRAPVTHVVIDMYYPAVLVYASILSMTQWCVHADLMWDRTLAEDVLREWLRVFDVPSLMEEVGQMAQQQPTNLGEQVIKEQWQAAIFADGQGAKVADKQLGSFGLSEGQMAREFPESMLQWTPCTIQLAMTQLCDGPDPLTAAYGHLVDLYPVLGDEEARVEELNAMLGREPGSFVPDEVRYDRELVEWRNPADVVPPTVPGLLAKTVCIVGEFWPGIQVVLEWLLLAMRGEADEAMQWLAARVGLRPLRLRSSGWAWANITADRLYLQGTEDGQLSMAQLATLSHVGSELLGVGDLFTGDAESDSEYEGLAAYSTVAVAGQAAALQPQAPVCQCAQPAVLELGMWICAEGSCAYNCPVQAVEHCNSSSVRQTTVSLGQVGAVAAHDTLPQSFMPMQQFDKRPGTVLGRAPGTEPTDPAHEVLLAGAAVRKLEPRALARQLGPEALHVFMLTAEGALYVSSVEPVTSRPQGNAALQSGQSGQQQHAPLVSTWLSEEQLARYKAAVPGVFFLCNEEPSQGMLLSHRGRTVLDKRLMMDDGADCVIIAQELAHELGLEWGPSARGVHTSCGGVQQAMGLVSTPFQLIVAQGTPHQQVLQLGGPDVPVFVSKEGGLFHMLVDQNVRHRLSGFVDPLTERFHYRPQLWVSGNASQWYSLPGHMYRRVRAVPSASPAVQAEHEEVCTVIEALAAAVEKSCPTGTVQTVAAEAAHEAAAELVECRQEPVSWPEPQVQVVEWTWDWPWQLGYGGLALPMHASSIQIRQLVRMQRWLEALCVGGAVPGELPSHVKGAGVWLVMQWQAYLDAAPVQVNQASWGFPVLVDPGRAGLWQQITIAYLLPILESLVTPRLDQVVTWEDNGLGLLFELLRYVTHGCLQDVAGAVAPLPHVLVAVPLPSIVAGASFPDVEDVVPALDVVDVVPFSDVVDAVPVPEIVAATPPPGLVMPKEGLRRDFVWTLGLWDTAFAEGLSSMPRQLPLSLRQHLCHLWDFANMALSDGMGQFWGAQPRAVAAAMSLLTMWCDASLGEVSGVPIGFPLLPFVTVNSWQHQLLAPMCALLQQCLLCTPYESAFNQGWRETLLTWLKEAAGLLLAATAEQSHTCPVVQPSPPRARRPDCHDRLGPGPRLPSRYKRAGGKASVRRGRRRAVDVSAASLGVPSHVLRAFQVAGVRRKGRKHKLPCMRVPLELRQARTLAVAMCCVGVLEAVDWGVAASDLLFSVEAAASFEGAELPETAPAMTCTLAGTTVQEEWSKAGTRGSDGEEGSSMHVGTSAPIPDVIGLTVIGTQTLPSASAPTRVSPAGDSSQMAAAGQAAEPAEDFAEGERVFAQLQGVTCGYLRATMPEGDAEVLLHPGYTKDEENLWIWGNHPEFTAEQLHRFKEVLQARRACFAYSVADLHGYTGPLGEFTIPLEHDQPIRQKPRRMSHKETEIVNAKCKELLDAGFIAPCPVTMYGQNVVVAAKKDEEGNWTDYRFCIDYRPINKVTPADKYPLHLADDLWDRVGAKRFLTKIDMRSGFHNVKVAVADQPKTAFWWGNRLYMWNRAPFGLKCIANFFQRIMDDTISRAGLEHCCTCFIDDLLVFSDTADEHIAHVCAVLDAVASVGLKAHPGKSILGAPVVEYLGHNVSVYGVAPTEAKVAAIRAIQAPSAVGQLRAVLGLLSYYRCYVPNFGAIASPLTDLTKAQSTWQWLDDVHGVALRRLIDLICTPGRVLRRADPLRPFILHTDWSKTGVGAVLGQLDDEGQEYLVACISRSLNKHERNYSSPQGEMLAAVWGVKSFRHYLRFTHFTLSTDHQALQWLVSTKELSGQYARWALILQEFDFTVVHRPGTSHQNADAVSRMPLPTMHDSTGARLDVEPIPRAACLAALGGGGLSMASHIHTAVVTALVGLDYPPVPWTVSDVLHLPAPGKDFLHPVGEDQEALTHASMQAVHGCLASLQAMYTPEPLLLKVHRGGPRGGVVCDQLCTVLVSQPFFAAAYGQGITLYEPFGGLGAGVEMALRCGWKICQYLYSDIDPHARAVIRLRLGQLHERYPQLLPVAAYQQVFRLPQNVYQVTSEHLLQVGAGQGGQWLVVAGWECQDMSPAGTGRGLQGPRSKSFFPLLNLLASLQLLQQQHPPGYLIENTAFQFHHHDKVAVDDFQHICGMLHQPVVLDAAQFGSYAHRVRNFWTNLADSGQLQRVMREVKRPAGRLVTDILPSHVLPLPVQFDDTPPRYLCNKVGQPMQALPCLVAHGCSRAFRDLGAGVLYNTLTQQYEQPSVVVRELALGYPAGCTAAPGVPEQARHAITGRAMDAYCMQFLGATCAALAQAGFGTPRPQILAVAPPALVTPLGSGVTPAGSDRPTLEPELLQASAGVIEGCVHQQGAAFHDEDIADPGFQLLLSFACLAAVATAMDAEQVDIWADTSTLAYLQTGQLPTELHARRRVVKRAKHYAWTNGVLKRVMQDGTSRLIPKVEDREQVIVQVHAHSGHFGRRRTTYLLYATYWWHGLASDVARVVRNCATCDRVKATFNQRHPMLHPLPIQGLMYRWGVDLAGPFRVTERGNAYVMVMVEHFSKWVELTALPAKASRHTAEAFLDRVICRFGAPAEVVTDRGTEFEGDFAELLQRCMIDHRTTSPDHPQADGLAERVVQTMKRALRKVSVDKGAVQDWDLDMHWIALGYRCSVQEATGYSPYALLYGLTPVVPPAVRERLAPGVDYFNPDRAAEQLRARAAAMKRACAIAGHNITIAQHRDTLRYAKVRSGGYVPKLFKYQVGDYVYLKQGTDKYTLDPKARPAILRVRRVNGDGSLQLQGQCGSTVTAHGDNCAPCHLQIIDGRIDHRRSVPSIHTPCEVCGLPDRGDVMILCDTCGKGWHTFCLDPPLEAVPEGDFQCPVCAGEWSPGTTQALAPVGKGRKGLQPQVQWSKVQRDEIEASRKLHGRVRAVHSLDDKGKPIVEYGVLSFLGEAALPRCLEVEYTNGSKRRLTSQGAQRGLMQPGFQLPEGVINLIEGEQVAAVAAAGEWVDYAAAWPDQLVTRDGKDMQQVLKRLMPGTWVLATCTRLHNSRPGTAAYVDRVLQCRNMTSPLDKVKLLAKVVNVKLASNIVDAWSDMLPSQAGVWLEAGWKVLRNAAQAGIGLELEGDTTQPSWYRKVIEDHGLGLIVGVPWARLLDLVLPLAVGFAAEGVCVDVPVTWLANAPTARAEWLDVLNREGRLLVIMGVGIQMTTSGAASCWLCIFKDPWHRSRLLRPAYSDTGALCWAK